MRLAAVPDGIDREVALGEWVTGLAGVAAVTSAGALALRYRSVRRLARARDAAFDRLVAALDGRHVLTLHLVRICSGYLVLEAPVLEAVALARYYAMQARTVLARTKTETDLCWALGRLMLAAEGHPELASHPRLRTVVRQVAAAEDRAAAARAAYNAASEALAAAVRGPLGRVLGRLAGVEAPLPFELDPTVAREAMMALLTPRPAPGAPDAAAPRPVAPPLASVAFGT